MRSSSTEVAWVNQCSIVPPAAACWNCSVCRLWWVMGQRPIHGPVTVVSNSSASSICAVKQIAYTTTAKKSRFLKTIFLGFRLLRYYARSSYCFQRVLAIAILSVCLSVTRVDQSKTVQARITKFSPLGTWKTLVSGTVKLFHKFEWGHPERGR